MNAYLKHMSTDEILCEFESAANDLRGSGARGRSRFYDVREELVRRLDGEDNGEE